MFCKSSYTTNTFKVIFFLVLTITEASIKWEIKTKPLVIGKEVRLSCYGKTCPSKDTKKWFGGKNYDLLCSDGRSKIPSKYEMTSSGSNFDLMIKDFNETDVNCEYSCACGFQQYTNMLDVDVKTIIHPPILLEHSLAAKGGNILIDVLIDVYPSPECTLVSEGNVLSSNITVRTIPNASNFRLFEIVINHYVRPGESICKRNLSLNCSVGYTAYKVHLSEHDFCKDIDEDTLKIVLKVTIGSAVVIVSLIVFVVILISMNYVKRRKWKDSDISDETKYDEACKHNSNYCMAKLVERNDDTRATDEETPCNK